MSVLKIGTRPSKLAVAQSTTVADRLTAAGHPSELVTISTSGDRSSAPIPQIGVGVFVSQLRDALYAGEIDVAVHSYKDLPSAQPDGLTIAAIPEREDVRDALVTGGRVLGELGRGARVGTGSPRRTVQLHALGQGLEVLPIRGNVDTRIGKVRSGELDAVVIAAAGLRRLGRVDEADELIDPLQMLPAPAQGALAIECRTADTDLVSVLAAVLDDSGVRFAVTAERAVLAGLEAECTTPVGALAEVVSDLDDDGRAVDRLSLRGALGIGDIAGGDVVRASATGDMDDAEKIGAAVALELLDLGAEDLPPAGPGGPANR
ncbi:hydroxymethylbilane synthase [Pseudonocardia alni]|uniref:Porphobilinogen deaminase n=1 Tax=Pseudonocardia alni TaxID=33907 RepID=A0A852W9K4_PSEA5|nr:MULTISPECIES: hydroxymethylbilane synthase [Pseudonocardia]MCO7196379.1 hydroxymethylbilane synthase [Pseudonocardia sp. McavD-2-B]MYW73747.1 hydroxymethylbilane synthase [Pseudonocardia sp. SID8383]NYG03424.1 hydroxymethylbilane synthase [Pseudonocardia antarctica]OJG05637.1 Porphobilinogen deaminase [Pseudonocardia autotrophica]